MKQIAIIGATASGKTALSIEMAQKYDAYILSLDTLSIYKEVDIVSAKPTIDERAGIKHFGIDEIYLDESFSVIEFFKIYERAKQECEAKNKNLIIVGGSSFYLKSLINGLSSNLNISKEVREKSKEKLKNLSEAYSFIKEKDFEYSKKISQSDSYRIEKWYEIFLSQNIVPTKFFLINKKKSLINSIKVFNIELSKDKLRDRIKLRTNLMIKNGLIDEVYYLEKRYGRNHIAMRSIGLIETLKYLDGKLTIRELEEQITLHTIQLAKRQTTFNKSQFPTITTNIKDNLKIIIDF
ncbi:MAG TPA: tRNA (adenosine(37)-N6)-dimethylallyltransferase MiaA [Campylobacterales bacterium]|nr:tRNA (adenosine(37)-N6)-dimethylallyltransferase MiaA [Campylobacterales bacterium]